MEKDWDEESEKIKSSCKRFDNIVRLNNLLHKARTATYDLFTKLQDEGKIDGLSLPQIKKLIQGGEHKIVNVFEFLEERTKICSMPRK